METVFEAVPRNTSWLIFEEKAHQIAQEWPSTSNQASKLLAQTNGDYSIKYFPNLK